MHIFLVFVDFLGIPYRALAVEGCAIISHPLYSSWPRFTRSENTNESEQKYVISLIIARLKIRVDLLALRYNVDLFVCLLQIVFVGFSG